MTEINSQASNGKTLYKDYDKWNKLHDVNTTKANSLLELFPEKSEKISDAFEEMAQKLGTHFDYQQDGLSREESLLNFAQGEVQYKDMNKDNELNLFEYIASEVSKESVGDEVLTGNLITKGMAIIDHYDDNGNDTLSADELLEYYDDMDKFETDEFGNSYTVEADGKIRYDANFDVMENIIGYDNAAKMTDSEEGMNQLIGTYIDLLAFYDYGS